MTPSAATIISAAVSTSRRSTPAGVARCTGPAMSVTSAPASRAASATAKPILPELRLLMNRTGSIGSRVGPAVTSTRRPPRLPAIAAGGGSSRARTMSAGSTMRPGPTSPQAWLPEAGPMKRTPRDSSVARLAWVAACRHMAWFIAGASTSGASVAMHRVVSRLPAVPAASRAIKWAVAGATSTRSAQRASSMWPMAASASSSQSSERTGLPDTAWNTVGDTMRVALGVMTTRTSAPASLRRRTRSGLLYAAMPPVTPSRTC